MALRMCPDCKKEISDRAFRCPACGHVFSGKWLRLLLQMLFILFMIWWAVQVAG